MKLFLSLIVTACVCQSFALNANVYQAADPTSPTQTDFPEDKLLSDRPSTAIAFSGGGVRAYTAALGQLAALNQLGLMDKVRYIGGISGGTWASAMYTFAQNQNDAVLLGPIPNPSDIDMSNIGNMDPACARSYGSFDVAQTALTEWIKGGSKTFGNAWCDTIWQAYLKPAGIPENTFFSWSEDTVNDIISRNPSLANQEFLLPANAQRPFPIFGATLIGPENGVPYGAATNNFTRLEFTPLYVGEFRSVDVNYQFNSDHAVHPAQVGGAVETFAFPRAGSPPPAGLPIGQTLASVNVPTPSIITDISFAVGASSYFPGTFASTIQFTNIADATGLEASYFSPSDPTPQANAQQWMIGDGGAYDNLPLISFIQRRVQKIVLFFNDNVALQPSSKWNVDTDAPNENQIVDYFQAYFGVFPSVSSIESRTCEYTRNQVFATSDYATVIKALQAAQADGHGIMTTQNLVTVENTWWGIPAGINVQVTFVYLGRLSAWESQLPFLFRKLVVPEINGDDLSNTIDAGPFRSFPQYPTLGGLLNAERANLLADLTGWGVLQHAAEFQQILS